jgi:hypothetical protein
MRRKQVLILTSEADACRGASARGRLTLTFAPYIDTPVKARVVVDEVIKRMYRQGIVASPKLPEPHR